MTDFHAPFRFDYVGSFLRPDSVKEAREKFEAGEMSADELRAVEDEAIKDLIAKQKRSGYHVITDGEFRRSYWHLDFMWGLNGAEKIELDHGYIFHGEETTPGSVALVGKVSGENHPFVEDYKFVKQFEEEGIVAKQTMPAPAQFLAELFREENGKNTIKYYPEVEPLIEDIAQAYRTVIAELYAAGCRNIQFDDCTWGMFCDENYQKFCVSQNTTMEHFAKQYLDLNNKAIEGKPEDLVITTHVCRGNYHSTWASQGGYEPIGKFLFAEENVSAFYLEFDDDRSGDFEPLRYVADDKKVVLGLITSKSPILEDKDVIKKRIEEATKYIPLDRLYLSPQCGFASCEIGNKLTEDEQWAKLQLVKEIAEEVWG